MFDGDEFVFEGLGFSLGAREHVVHGLSDVHFGGIDAAGDFGDALEFAIHGERERAGGEAEFVDETGDEAALLGEQSGEQMPRVDLVVVESTGDGLGVRDGLAGHLGEGVQVHIRAETCRDRASVHAEGRRIGASLKLSQFGALWPTGSVTKAHGA